MSNWALQTARGDRLQALQAHREDRRNREKWADYQETLTDMIDRTSTHGAPWTIVEAEDKRFARIKVSQTFADRIEDAL